jgi:hypothetical protein
MPVSQQPVLMQTMSARAEEAAPTASAIAVTIKVLISDELLS